MGEFSFRLDRILNLRITEERVLATKLAGGQRKLQAKQKELAGLRQTCNQVAGKMRACLKEGVDVSQLMAYQSYLGLLGKQTIRAAGQVAKQKQEVAAQRERLLQKAKARTVLEKLRDRRYDEYRQEMKREDQKRTDEIGTAYHWRNDSGNTHRRLS